MTEREKIFHAHRLNIALKEVVIYKSPLFHLLQPQGGPMPEKETKERAQKLKREGKAPSTQATTWCDCWLLYERLSCG
jgi:hypothetical protein